MAKGLRVCCTTGEQRQLCAPLVDLSMFESRLAGAAPIREPAILALICGYVDSFTLSSFGVYASFMSGNTTQTGLQAGYGKFAEAGHNLLPIPLFVIGIFLGTLLAPQRAPYALRRQLLIVAGLLAAGVAVVSVSAPAWLCIAVLSIAMGIMNTTVSRGGGQHLSVGFVTGDLNSLAQHIASAVKREPVPQAEGSWDTHWRRAGVLAVIWSAFLLGAVLGAVLMPRFGIATLAPPLVVLLGLAAESQ
jgi:uncharacterized membrane protein YoaK (UPF0700 family)